MSVTDVRTYTVQVFRQDSHWILEVPELRAVGQSRTLANAGPIAQELVALWLDVPADQVQVVLDYGRIDPEAITDGLSLRDAATVLEVTFGRVQQLLKD